MRATLVVGGFLAKMPRPTPAKLVALLAAVLATVVMALGLGASAVSAATFSNNNGITINDGVSIGSCTPTKATPYPSEIAVSGLGSSISDVNVTISGLSHQDPDDVGLLLVSPAGQRTILMTDSGGLAGVSGINLTFDDAASGTLPNGPTLSSGTYKPSVGPTTDCLPPGSFPDAPLGPYGSSLSVFNGTNPNGTWKLYVIDDTGGGSGSITGWSLDISASTPGTSTPDTRHPRVISTVPTSGASGVGPLANVNANFSEDMRASSINTNTFKLFKQGSTTKVGATVSYNANKDTAILNPTNSLQRGASYKAVVTTGARDEAGNRLDQNRSLSGLQKKVWFFEVSE